MMGGHITSVAERAEELVQSGESDTCVGIDQSSSPPSPHIRCVQESLHVNVDAWQGTAGALGPDWCDASCALWSLHAAAGDMAQGPFSGRWLLDEGSTMNDLHLASVRFGVLMSSSDVDARFFGILAAEAQEMEPRQRLLLEMGYGALHQARQRSSSLMDNSTGVFVGLGDTDGIYKRGSDDPHSSPGGVFVLTGSAASIASGRLSYIFGMQGPSICIDTACSSGIVVINAAVSCFQCAQSKEALVSAVSLKLSLHLSVQLGVAGFLSRDGRCKTFDQHANGILRAEGVGAFVLRVSADAHGADQGTYQGALILASAVVQQDGRSASLTAPNGSAQCRLLKRALDDAGDSHLGE